MEPLIPLTRLELTSEATQLESEALFCMRELDAKAGTLRGEFVPYPEYVADRVRAQPLLRPIGVSGLVWIPSEGGEGRILVGKRSQGVTQYPGYWETMPSGSIEPRFLQDGKVDHRAQLIAEFAEETRFPESWIERIDLLGLIPDGSLLDICSRITLSCEISQAEARLNQVQEYDQAELIPLGRIHSEIYRPGRDWVPTSVSLVSFGFSR